MELKSITKEQIKKNRKYFSDDIPNWEAFFDAIPVASRGAVASDFYKFKDEIGLGNFLDYLTYLPEQLFANSDILDIVIPSNVKEIGAKCFYNCKNLLSCDIQGDVKEIPSQCFSNCSSLQELILPKTISKIGFNAFAGCNNEVKIFSEKTGRNIQTTESQIAFLKDHFVEKN